MLNKMGIKARNAAAVLAKSTDAQRIAALLRMSENLMDDTELILAANQEDLTAAAGTGMTQAMLDRLALTPKRVTVMAQALRETAALPDPLGEISGKIRVQMACKSIACLFPWVSLLDF